MLLLLTHGRTLNQTLVALVTPIVFILLLGVAWIVLGIENPRAASTMLELRNQSPIFFWSNVLILIVGVVLNFPIACATQHKFTVPRLYMLFPIIVIAAFLLMPFLPPDANARPTKLGPWLHFFWLCSMAYLGILDFIHYLYQRGSRR